MRLQLPKFKQEIKTNNSPLSKMRLDKGLENRKINKYATMEAQRGDLERIAYHLEQKASKLGSRKRNPNRPNLGHLGILIIDETPLFAEKKRMTTGVMQILK